MKPMARRARLARDVTWVKITARGARRQCSRAPMMGLPCPVRGARAVPIAEPKWPPRPKVEDARGATEVELNDQTTPRAPQCSARRSLRLHTRSYDAAARKRRAGGRARFNPIGPRRFLLPTEAAGAADRARL
jgi:hypothetical protein